MSNFRNFETTKDAARAAVLTTASQTLWTPASGKRIRLNAFSVSVSAAGFFEVFLGSRRIFTFETAGADFTGVQDIPSPGDLGAVDGALTVKNNASGTVSIASSAWGREE